MVVAKKKHPLANTTAEYLLGVLQMKSWPIVITILAPFLSAISLLGLPVEIYTYELSSRL